MKVKVLREVEVEVKYVRIKVPVLYGDEDIPYDFPFRSDDVWDVTVDVETGKIIDWPPLGYEVHMKVCDAGSYFLLDADRLFAGKIIQDYVPHGVVPGRDDDYIEMDIDEDGTVRNWPKRPKFDEFFRRDE